MATAIPARIQQCLETKAKSIILPVYNAGFTHVSVVGMVVLTRHESKFGTRLKRHGHPSVWIDALTG